jgi:hypothetical protein
MKHSIFLPVFLFGWLGFCLQVVAQPDLITTGTQILIGPSTSDFIVPSGVLQLSFEVVGGDGGIAQISGGLGCTSPGGKGARANVVVIVGNGPGQVPVGSTIRFIVGDSGNGDNMQFTGLNTVGAAGGGGTAVLYKSTSPPAMFTFEPICVAGGGGGAYQSEIIGLCTGNQPGQPGRAEETGGNGTGSSPGLGGTNLLGGGSGLGGGGGGGANGNGGGIFCLIPFNLSTPIAFGSGTWENGGAGGNGSFCTTDPLVTHGGFGYGGGGGGLVSALNAVGGGGGGGYNGGGGGGVAGAGGGGGSHLMSGLLTHTLTAGPSNSGFEWSVGYVSYHCVTDLLEANQNLFHDKESPIARCKNATVLLDGNGNASVTTAQIDNGTTDNSPFTLSLSKSNFNCSNVNQPVQIILTATDVAGNKGQCAATVTVVDAIPPVLICQPKTVFLNPSGSVSIVPSDVVQSSSDNCGVVNLVSVTPATFNCSNLGANTVTILAKDAHNNQTTCTAAVTVADNLPPVIVCKSKILLLLNAAGSAAITPAYAFQSGTDNCGTVNLQSLLPNTFTCADLGQKNTTLTVNDGHGNTSTCLANVVIFDQIAPTMICHNVTLNLNAVGQAFLTTDQVNNGSFDNCTLSSMTLDQTAFTCAHLGNNTVTLKGFDQSNNSSQCTATVTVRDLIVPVARCRNTTLNLGSNGTLVLLPGDVDNGSSDNCAFSLQVSQANFSCANVGVNLVTLKATDGSGNVGACQSSVTVRDVTPPTALCKNPTIYLDAEGHGTLSVAQCNNGSFDACGIASMAISKAQFDCSNLPGSAQSVILSMTDVNGNSSSCIAYATVKDALAPTAVCQNATVYLEANGKATVYGATLAADSYDNCAVWSYSPVAKVYTAANLGDNNLTITVKDWSGNVASCVSVVTVLPHSGSRPAANQADRSINSVDLQLYPNPTAGNAMLSFELTQPQSYQILVYDMTGNLVLNQQGEADQGRNLLPVNSGSLMPGMYVVQLRSEGFVGEKRLVVVR